MTIWKVGMLAVCIKDNRCPVLGGDFLYKKGRVYRVRAVKTGHCKQTNVYGTGLKMEGIESRYWRNALSFRPAVQDWQSEKQSRTSKLDDMLKGRVPV